MILLKARGPLSQEEKREFEEQRLRIYAYLAMHSPQSVMKACDKLIDLILAIIYDEQNITWPFFRELAINLLNEIRKDLGLNPTPISYQGKR